MKRTGGPAFPCSTVDFGNGPENPSGFGMDGMTLRDYFAGEALKSIVAKGIFDDVSDYAAGAYKLADAMLAERDGRQK